jgi:hypothetical protein
VVSVDGTPESQAAVTWCADHLRSDDRVVAVCGVGLLGELALTLPPFEVGITPIEQALEDRWCRPLRDAGLRYERRMLAVRQRAALYAVIDGAPPDLLVIGRQAHHGALDAAVGKGFDHLLRRPPCPVLIVPPDGRATALSVAVVDVKSADAVEWAAAWCRAHLAGRTAVIRANDADTARVAVEQGADIVIAEPPAGIGGLGLRHLVQLCRHVDAPVLLTPSFPHAPSPVLRARPPASGARRPESSRFWAAMRDVAASNPLLGGDLGFVTPVEVVTLREGPRVRPPEMRRNCASSTGYRPASPFRG